MKNLTLIFLLLTFYHAGAQCELKSEVQSEHSTSLSDGKISLTLTSNLDGPASVTLYDIMDAKFPVIEEKKLSQSQQKSPIVFSGLKATTYIIKVSWRNCTKTIGGLEGIKIDQKK
jgi:hypothetical protein